MSAEPQPRGCLAALFGASKPQVARPETPSYRLRADFLSVTELSFLRTAQIAVSGRFTIMTKVNLNDVFFSPTGDPGHRNRINQKHVDFLFCDPQTLKPMLGVELDDASHQRPARVERDALVDGVFASAGLPLLHLPARPSYASTEIAAAVEDALVARASHAATAALPNAGVPLCPNCGVPMVVREAGRGSHAGRSFYGCPNYPRCREIRPPADTE
jgi:hypothetical protein